MQSPGPQPILALESGGTKLVAALADSRARLLRTARRRRPPENRAPETLALLADLGREVLGKDGPPAAVGFGFGGLVDRRLGRPALCYHEDGWDEVDAAAFLEKHFQAPVFVENDCAAAALAEAHFGPGSPQGSLFYMTVGTGIGGALVSDGRLLQTGRLGEGEIGHLVVDPEGPICPCGNRGCLESLCSGPGLAELTTILLNQRIDSITLLKYFRMNSPPHREVVLQAVRHLGRALATVVNLFNPDRIVLGGGVLQDGSDLIGLIEQEALRHTFPPFRGHARFLLTSLDEAVVCQGAALLALESLRGRAISPPQ